MSESSADVYLVNCDPDHFERTVGTGIDPDDRSDLPDHLVTTDPVRLWALEGGDQNEENFERLASGDLVLFYADGEYVGTGTVAETESAGEEWSKQLFGGEERPLVFTVTDFSPVAVPRALVNGLFEYSETWVPGGLFRVADSRVENTPAAIKLAIEEFDERHG